MTFRIITGYPENSSIQLAPPLLQRKLSQFVFVNQNVLQMDVDWSGKCLNWFLFSLTYVMCHPSPLPPFKKHQNVVNFLIKCQDYLRLRYD